MIHKTFIDDVYPKQEIIHIRETVRMIAVFQDRFAFLTIDRNDCFGHCQHFETLGGGIEVNESHADAIHRELLEESGWVGEIVRPLCIIEDDYHLLQRHTISHFYEVRLLKQVQPTAYTQAEQQLIKGLVFLTHEEVIQALSTPPPHSLQKLIYQRDLFAYQIHLENY